MEDDLPKRPVNYEPLTPNGFIDWAAHVYPERPAVVHGDYSLTYQAFRDRCYQMAHALAKLGVGKGDVVSVLSPNTPVLLMAHFGVPLLGAVLNAINTRLEAEVIGYILDHAESRVFIVDPELMPLAQAALAEAENKPILFGVTDAVFGPPADWTGFEDLDAAMDASDPGFDAPGIEDEWQAISLNYTSGTTGRPKGVLFHHRGAYLVGINNQFSFRLAPLPVYLWTLPMFHCNGWGNSWAITKLAGLHVCLRQPNAPEIFDAIDRHGVTHASGAPVVLNMLIHADAEHQRQSTHAIHYTVGGAPPPAAMLEKMEAMNFIITHGYGLTETYGPAGGCEWNPDWDDLPLADRAEKQKRQGVQNHTLSGMTIIDPDTMQEVAADGETMGEIMMRGNTIMKGYFKDEAATRAAFAGDWFHSGDLGVRHPDNYVELRDRSKDIIISGGENISSLEVEGVLVRHPEIFEAAVVAGPHERWGETPLAFVDCGPDTSLSPQQVIDWCRERLAHFKCPTEIRFGPLPKTGTGKVRKNILRDQLHG